MNYRLFGVKRAEQSSLLLHVELLAAYSSGRVRGLSPSVYASAKGSFGGNLIFNIEAPYLTDMELKNDYEAIVRLNSLESELGHRFFDAPFTAQKTR